MTIAGQSGIFPGQSRELGDLIMQRPLQRPNRLTSRLYAYRHAALFLIFLLIVQLFNVLEQTVVPRFWVECSLDQYIPFIPVFVVP